MFCSLCGPDTVNIEMSKTPNTEMLPEQFTKSLRVLFDILDEHKCGFVRLCDIESRWHEEGVHGLPSGVIGALRKVTPSGGYLSFEDFVNGLKFALFKRDQAVNNRNLRMENKNSTEQKNDNKRPSLKSEKEYIKNHRTRPSHYTHGSHHNNFTVTTAKVKPNNALNNQMPKLKESENIYHNRDKMGHSVKPDPPSRNREVGSTTNVWKKTDGQGSQLTPQVPPRNYCKNVNELRNIFGHANVPSRNPRREARSHSVSDSKLTDRKSLGNSNGVYANIEDVCPNLPTGKSRGGSYDDLLKQERETTKRETRRHTLADGVDYNMIKRLKQLEQEKDILLHGLDVVERTKDWYRKQIDIVVDRQNGLGRREQDFNVEKHQEKIHFQKARISDVNQQLKALMENLEKGFPSHMNLVTCHSTSSDENTIKMLKEQNRLLTQEVSQKSDKISQLETEKASLVRDVFRNRAKNKGSNDDSTCY